LKRKKKKLKGLNEAITVTVRVGEADDPLGEDVRWKLEKEVDLILDQFGKWLAALIRPVPGASQSKTVQLQDITNATRTLNIYATSNTFNYGGLSGNYVGVGSSNQTPVRSDYNLISQLGSLAVVTDGVWTSATGKITFSGSVYLSAGGTVREVGFFAYYFDSGAAYRTFMLFRDVISDVVIGAGKYAFVQYTINL